jgi:flagellin
MSRINTNISSLQAIHRLNRNNSDLATRLQRLSSGLKINTGKDAPAALIASETLRSEISGINQAINNSQRAMNVVNTAEGALSEVSALLLEIQSLTIEAANNGALSPQEIRANQLQVDAILNSINRISNTTQFNGVKLLNGELDYSAAGVTAADIASLQINAAKLPDSGDMSVVVTVAAAAGQGAITYAGGALTNDVTLEIAGNTGAEQLSFGTGTAIADIATAVNAIKESTGVEAVVDGTDLIFRSSRFGASQFVEVNTISGTFAGTATKAFGSNAEVTVNGQKADVDGLTASVRSSNLDLTLSLTQAFAGDAGGTYPATTSFDITGGGARFQIGSEVNRPGQVHIGIGSVATTRLGDNVIGFLSTLASGGDNSLVSGNTTQAQRILSESITQVASARGRLGAFQKNVLETNINSLSVALENVTASESAIRDADFAAETAALTRAQILVQANTSVLAQANASPQNVLALLRG